MKSVNNIKKMTMAMKMVAASKLRTTQVKAENSRGLWQPFTALLGDAPAIQANNILLVVLSSDKGLCGGINSTSVKYARSLQRLHMTGGDGKRVVKFALVGDKASRSCNENSPSRSRRSSRRRRRKASTSRSAPRSPTKSSKTTSTTYCTWCSTSSSPPSPSCPPPPLSSPQPCSKPRKVKRFARWTTTRLRGTTT